MNERTKRMTADFFARCPNLLPLETAFSAACELLLDCYAKGGKLLVCGNGGSCADADHIVGELMKGFLLRRPLGDSDRARFTSLFGAPGTALAQKLQGGLPAISLCAHTSLNSAFANDVDAALSFAQQTFAYAGTNDVLLGISTSGNAENVCAAMMAAAARGARRIALTGRDGGRLAALADCALIIPENETYRIQEEHLKLYHLLCAAIESESFAT